MPARFLVGCLLLCAAVEVSALCAVNPYKAAYQKTKFSFGAPKVNPYTVMYQQKKWTADTSAVTAQYRVKKWTPDMAPPAPPTPPSSSDGRGDRPEGDGDNSGLLIAGVLAGAGVAYKGWPVLRSMKFGVALAEA
jgi:hypothetical protein